MDAAHIIRDAVARVTALRTLADSHLPSRDALKTIKKLQAQRFAGTYADLLTSTEYRGATHFFLDELYSDKDYSLRDAQFARIAGALQTFFPEQVVATAVSLAQLHILTEELDHKMAIAWLNLGVVSETSAGLIEHYMSAWKTVGHSEDRNLQLSIVLNVGFELDRLTRTRGLRLMLKMMRRPASAAGLGSLQNFLECGFDTFAEMSGKGARAKEFLDLIRRRESHWIASLFSSDTATCARELQECLGAARA